MSISIVDTPQEVDFCKNPLAFKVTGSNYITVAGVAAQLNVDFTAGDVNGNTFTISFLDYDLIFVCATTPDDSGLQYPPKGAESLAAYIDIVRTYLAKNYYLTKYYTISFITGNIIKILAKQTGSDYDLSIDVGTSNIAVVGSGGGTDETVASNFKIWAQLLIENVWGSDIFESINEILTDPDENGSSIIYIDKKLKSTFTEPELPTYNYNDIELFTESFKKYYLLFAEYYGSDPVIKSIYNSGDYYCFNGRLPIDKFPGHDFVGDLEYNMQFLSNKPKTRDTWKLSQQFLFFYYIKRPVLGEIVRIAFKLYYTSGKIETKSLGSLPSQSQQDLLCIPCGFEQMGLSSYGDIHKYDVYIYIDFEEEGITPISEIITFVVHENPPVYHTFLYKNDFGFWETLEVAKIIHIWDSDKDTARKALLYDYEIPDKEFQSFGNESSAIYEANTRLMPKNEALALRELFLNDELFFIGNDNYYSCELFAGSFELIDENNDLFSVKFKFRISYANNWIVELTKDAVTSDVGSYDEDYDYDYD